MWRNHYLSVYKRLVFGFNKNGCIIAQIVSKQTLLFEFSDESVNRSCLTR